MLLGAIDPGLRVCGVSLFVDNVLRSAGLVKSSNEKDRGMTAWRDMALAVLQWLGDNGPTTGGFLNILAGERMQVYSGSKQEGDPNDLIELAGVLGAVSCRLLPRICVTYSPRDWKEQTRKPAPGTDPESYVIAVRCRKRLTVEEQTRIQLPTAKSLQHNVWDAIGIGLKAAGRFDRHRTLTGIDE